jgi:hypothetical protein
MREQQRDRIRPTASSGDHVQTLSLGLGAELAQPVELTLQSASIERPPIAEETA